jgi:hypothetical protein
MGNNQVAADFLQNLSNNLRKAPVCLGTARFADRKWLSRVGAGRSDRLLTAPKKAAGDVPDPSLSSKLRIFLVISAQRPVVA